MIKLIALDLDGTLLDANGELPPRRIEALERASKSGVLITLATGRMYTSAAAFAKIIPLTAPLIVYNGAMIRDAGKQGTIFHAPIYPALARSVMTYLRERGLYVQAYVNDRLLVERSDDPRAAAYCKMAEVEAVEMGAALYRLDDPTTKLLSIDEPGNIKPIKEMLRSAFGEEISLAASVSKYLEISAAGVSKGKAVKKLAEFLNIKTDEVMSIGDGDNDASMLEVSGVGIAVCCSSPLAQAKANYVVPAGVDPIVWAVEKFMHL